MSVEIRLDSAVCYLQRMLAQEKPNGFQDQALARLERSYRSVDNAQESLLRQRIPKCIHLFIAINHRQLSQCLSDASLCDGATLWLHAIRAEQLMAKCPLHPRSPRHSILRKTSVRRSDFAGDRASPEHSMLRRGRPDQWIVFLQRLPLLQAERVERLRRACCKDISGRDRSEYGASPAPKQQKNALDSASLPFRDLLALDMPH